MNAMILVVSKHFKKVLCFGLKKIQGYNRTRTHDLRNTIALPTELRSSWSTVGLRICISSWLI